MEQRIHTFMIIFCRSYPRERKSYPWILFLIKTQLEMKFLRCDLLSSSTNFTCNFVFFQIEYRILFTLPRCQCDTCARICEYEVV